MLFNACKKINKIYNTYLARDHFDDLNKKILDEARKKIISINSKRSF